MRWLLRDAPAVPVRFGCACGGVFAATAPPAGQAWTCPSCGRAWLPEPAAVERAALAVGELRRLRTLMTAVLLAAAAAAAALGIVHPGWLIEAPLLVGGTALAARPTYSKRRQRARAALRAPIRLSAAP